MTGQPLPFAWDGDAMVPQGWAKREADRVFVIGQVYRLVEHEERSAASHGHFFVCVHEAFQNLTDEQRMIWPNEDTLRKHALCKAACCDVATHVCPSEAAARAMAAFLTSNRLADLVTHDGRRVIALKAWSMAYGAMDRAKFRDAKDKALSVLAELIGVEPDALAKHARAA